MLEVVPPGLNARIIKPIKISVGSVKSESSAKAKAGSNNICAISPVIAETGESKTNLKLVRVRPVPMLNIIKKSVTGRAMAKIRSGFIGVFYGSGNQSVAINKQL